MVVSDKMLLLMTLTILLAIDCTHKIADNLYNLHQQTGH